MSKPGGSDATSEPSSLRGQVVHVRRLSKRLQFYDLEVVQDPGSRDSAGSTPAPLRHEVILKFPDVSMEKLADIKATIHLGDVVEMEGFFELSREAPADGAAQLGQDQGLFHCLNVKVSVAWRESNPGESFIPRPISVTRVSTRKRTMETPQAAAGAEDGVSGTPDSGGDAGSGVATCKYWVNTGRCPRENCGFNHPSILPAARSQYAQERKRAREEGFALRMQATLAEHQAFVPRSHQGEGQDEKRAGMGEATDSHDRDHHPRNPHRDHHHSSEHGSGGAFAPKRLRAKMFCDFLVETFGADVLSRGRGVIDVAGGRGEISFELYSRRGIPSTCVDPRPGKLSREQLKFLKKNRDAEPPPHVRCLFGNAMCDVPEQKALLAGASVVVAMHPDEATEVAIDFAMARGLPWAVVPCCVFARDNPHRLTPDGGRVSTYEEYLVYLRAKRQDIQTAVLGFSGRNVVLYSLNDGDPAPAPVADLREP